MKKILLCLGFCLGFLGAESSLDNLPISPSKIVYIKNITPKETLEKTLYIGQKISVTYSLLLLSSAQLVDVDFDTPIDPKLIELINSDDISWKLQENGSYQATYIYKILSKKATIPQIRATAISNNQKYKDITISPKISLDIYDLRNNPQYSGVVGNALKIKHTKTKMYDNDNTITILELESEKANLEDFSIPNKEIIKQGFQTIDTDKGIYYFILPRTVSNLSFDFFSLPINQFQSLKIPIVISYDNVAAQDDLKPKNIFLLYSTLFMILGIIVSFAIYFFFWRHKTMLVIAIVLIIWLVWHIFYHHNLTIKLGEEIKILPTQNSTTLFVADRTMEVQVIGSHGDFYKIQTPDDRIGWIKKRR